VPGPVQSVERAVAILRLLAGGAGPMGLAEVAQSLGLAKGTAHGLLRTLQGVGFVDQDSGSGKYRLAAATLGGDTGYLDVNELRSRALNWADALAARSGESVRIGRLVTGRVLVVHHVFRPDDTMQTLDVGALLPAHASALGKVLLAYDPGAAAALPDLEPFTWKAITTHRTLKSALAHVRRQGWAAEVEEMTIGEAAIAAPVRGAGGLVVGAIGLSGAVGRVCDRTGRPLPALVDQVVETARAVSRDLAAARW
jgi:DNA-binding IclR family transcriptional regulator